MNKWLIGLAVLAVIVLIALGMFGLPQYNVWQQGLAGQAELKRAEQSRQIQIEEAKAENESMTLLAEAGIKKAKMEAQAEIERAKGVAEANRIIGESLQGNTEYLTYLWIQGLNDSSGEVIYVPTESNLPILEAGRLKR